MLLCYVIDSGLSTSLLLLATLIIMFYIYIYITKGNTVLKASATKTMSPRSGCPCCGQYFSISLCRLRGVCTISATDHIGHNHIGHKPYRPQLHRPHEKTISAKTNNHIGHKNRTAILSSTFVSIVSLSLRLETSYSLPSHISRELKNFTAIDIFQSALT